MNEIKLVKIEATKDAEGNECVKYSKYNIPAKRSPELIIVSDAVYEVNKFDVLDNNLVESLRAKSIAEFEKDYENSFNVDEPKTVEGL